MLTTDRFAVIVSEVCSGLEGAGLMVVFCDAWLCHSGREYYFPRALIIVSLAALLIYFLNVVRIAALVLNRQLRLCTHCDSRLPLAGGLDRF